LALTLINRIEDSSGVKITPLDIMLNSLGQLAAQIDQHTAAGNAPVAGASKSIGEAGENGIIKRLFSKKAIK
jgi:hypothetical protein